MTKFDVLNIDDGWLYSFGFQTTNNTVQAFLLELLVRYILRNAAVKNHFKEFALMNAVHTRPK